MAITNGYATLAEYKLYSPIDSVDANDDSVIEDLIEAASRHIDKQTGRTFYGRTETRLFDVPRDLGRELRLDDDLLEVDTLTNGDGTVLTATDYYLRPRNVTPKYAVVLKESSTYIWEPDSDNNYEGAISLAGDWGYTSSRPDNINVACLEIAKALYERRTGQNMNMVARVTSQGVVMMPQGTPEWVAEALAAYRRRT